MTEYPIPSIEKIQAGYEALMSEVENKSVRNKRGIDLHVQIDRAVTAAHEGKVQYDQETLELLNKINDDILRTVFNLDPDKARGRT